LVSISALDLAQEILDDCLKDGTWPSRALEALIERALDVEEPITAANATRALFGVVIERLGDLFEPKLCDVYARMFAHIVSRTFPDHAAEDLFLRYRRIRQPRRFAGGEVNRVFVLSRVTLGADVAVTSVALAASKDRFPNAEICLVGPAKNAELFAADPRITPIAVDYGRSTLLRERLSAALELRLIADERSSVVIDPDSRLTQLGLIPICDDARYFFFESRAFGGVSDASLPALTSEWLMETFDTPPFRPYLAPAVQPKIAEIAVSLGVGENQDKRLGEDFEFAVLSALLARGLPVLLDRGAGGAEAERVDSLVQRLGAPSHLHLHDGSYASFASHILQSRLYVGYDSAGQHVASAGNVPLVSVFAGYACRRMFARWRPDSPLAHVVDVTPENRGGALARTLAEIEAALAREPAA
jgi:ADP-heptose:LPS heptosyltransferase